MPACILTTSRRIATSGAKILIRCIIGESGFSLTAAFALRDSQTFGVSQKWLPIDQIGKRQIRTSQLLIEPDTKVVQSDLGGQTDL